MMLNSSPPEKNSCPPKLLGRQIQMIRGLEVNPQPFQKRAPTRWGHLHTYSLTCRTSTNAQLIQTVSTAPELGLLVNTGFSPDDNVARTTKKARGMSFLPKADLRNLDPLYFTSHVRSLYSPLSWICNTSIVPHYLPELPCARICSKTGGEVCKEAAPRPIWDSHPAAAALFPSP